MSENKPLHFLIIDSWHPEVVARELAAGHLPALAHLLRHGRLTRDCSSIFPTVTPACLTSLATGVGPDRHGITGVLWYNRKADRYVHYWPYPQSLMWGTIDDVIEDFFLRLNAEHLADSVQTVFELLEAADVSSACINFPVSRGPYLHHAELPWFLRRLGQLPKDLALPGPRYMRHGDMIRQGAERNRFLRKYGFNDAQSAAFSAEVIRAHRPRFMLTYFNENDLRSHHQGPQNTGESLRRIDAELAVMMDAYGSWERAATEARWILTGDHSQSDTYPLLPGHAVNVFKAFPHHKVCPLRTGGLASGDYDFATSPNDRMCYFYFPPGKQHVQAEVLEIVSQWPSLDQVFWRDEAGGFHGYRRETGEQVSFRPDGPFRDPFGQGWQVSGAPGAVDARLAGDRIHYGRYPNAFERAASALSVPGGGSVFLTAQLGYEYTSGFPMGRGNHGSLHAQDTHVPLVTVGVELPARPLRTTDLVPLILRELGVPLPGYLAPALAGAFAGPIPSSAPARPEAGA